MRPSLPVLAFAFLCAACDPQGDCSHSYATPDVTFTCRGGQYSVTCVGVDPTRPSAPPYTCTCAAPDGTTSTFPLAEQLYTYEPGSTDFGPAYATVNASCRWNLSD